MVLDSFCPFGIWVRSWLTSLIPFLLICHNLLYVDDLSITKCSLHFSQSFTFFVFKLISVKCGEIVLQLMTLHFVTCLVDIFTHIGLTHLLPCHCLPLLPFYIFLGALLLVHKCGKYWLNVCILGSSCSSVMSWIWQTNFQLHVSVTDILPMHGLSGKTSAWPQIQLRHLLI